MKRNLFSLILLVTTIFMILGCCSDSYGATYLFAGGGGNFQLFQDEGKVDLKSALGVSFGFGTTLNNRWAIWSVYDYYTVGINNPEVAEDKTTLFKSDFFTMGSYLLNVDTTDCLKVNLIGGIEGSYTNIPEFGDYLSGVTGLMLSYNFYRGFNLWLAGTLSINDEYASSKIRLGLACPIGWNISSTSKTTTATQ